MFILIDGVERSREAIANLQRALSSPRVIERVGTQIAETANRIVRDLTPRQHNARERRGSTRRYGKPLYRGWHVEVDRSVSEAVYAATIRNYAVDTDQGAVVLGAVEHGAGRHDMYGVFGWFEGSNVVRARSAFLDGGRVELPGGRASELSSHKTVDVRFAIARERGWVNVGIAGAPGHIDHPGSPAHHMVEQTKQQLGAIVDHFQATLAAEYADAFNLDVGVS